MPFENRWVFRAMVFGVRRKPSTNVGFVLVVTVTNEVASANFDESPFSAQWLWFVSEFIDELDKVFNHRNATIANILTEVLDCLFRNTQGTGEMFRHDVRTLGDISFGKDVSSNDTFFFTFAFPVSCDPERILFLIFKIKFENFFAEIQMAVGTFERLWLAPAIDCFPCFWCDLVSQMSDTVIVHKCTALRLRLDNTVVDFVIDLISRCVEMAATFDTLTYNHESTWLWITTVGVFVYQHGLYDIETFQGTEHLFPRSVEAEIRPGV